MRRLLPSGFAIVALALIVSTGCTGRKDGGAKAVAKKSPAHDHASEGPHGGAIVEWGEDEYHLEFLVDHDKKQTTVYVLDDKAAKASPIAVETLTLILTHGKTPIEIALKADPDTADPKGKSSRFTAVHDELAKKIEFKGTIRGTVAGKPYEGDFVEKADHDHKKK